MSASTAGNRHYIRYWWVHLCLDVQERYTTGADPCFPLVGAPAPLLRPAIYQISRPHLPSLIKLTPHQFNLPEPLMYACHIKFSSHKAISRLLPLSRRLCVNLQPASASLRSLQSCRLRYFLNEFEARFLPNSIVFGLSILASVALLVSTNLKGSLKGDQRYRQYFDYTFPRYACCIRHHKSPLANRARPSRSASRIRNSPNYSRMLAV